MLALTRRGTLNSRRSPQGWSSRKGNIMSATTVSGPIRNDQVWTRAKRTVLIALAIAVLFVAADELWG
jgi:hypothetical protein